MSVACERVFCVVCVVPVAIVFVARGGRGLAELYINTFVKWEGATC